MSDVNHEGLWKQAPHSIRTWTHKQVNPLDLQVKDIDVIDIGHALARQCRYNGHCHGHLSVARHSLWVAQALADSHHPELELWGLLHDATEAYLGDMVKPLKSSPEMGLFVEAEDRAEKVIAEAFGLVSPMPAEVHEADRYVTVELEINGGLRDSWDSSYDVDEFTFIQTYDWLTRERTA